MPLRPTIRRILTLAGLVLVGVGALVVIHTWVNFRPAAITLGPETTFYFERDPPLRLRVHEAVHRRQMRDKSWVGRLWSALRYNFDYGYRLDEEAEAKAGELCLRIHRFSRDLSDYTTARSVFQARTYRAWAWDRMGVEVPDRVGEKLRGGAACHEILRGVVLDLPDGEPVKGEEAVELAAFRFLRAYGSSDRELKVWRARLDLAGYTEPAEWDLPGELPRFDLMDVGRAVAAPPDSAVDAATAGRALHRLTYYLAERMYVQLQPPPGGYRGRPLMAPGDAEAHTGVPLEEWPEHLLERAL
ncbi:MAG TPA: hypothetical protein VE173_12055, partial [Longimicrobiales bacterium]|nr:hypothetical protein [Longimicrobiales bacterium]